MSLAFDLPDIGEGVVEGEILEWHVAEGDVVTADQPLVSVLTDKATVEVASPRAGRIEKLMGQPGENLEVGKPILYFADGETPDVVPEPESSSDTVEPGLVFDFPLPEIGEGVMEGEVVEWQVAAGDEVAADQVVVSVLTDKATVEITAPTNGKIIELKAQPGDQVAVGQALLSMQSAAKEPFATGAVSAHTADSEGETIIPQQKVAVPADNPSISAFGTPLATPHVRRKAAEKGIDLSGVVGTGPNHRITLADLEKAADAPAAAAEPIRAVPTPSGSAGQSETREPIRGLRKAIYTKMSQSKRTVPHFTYVEEVEMDKLVAMRADLKAVAAAQGVKLNYLPFIAKAIAIAMKKFPIMNASVDDATMEIVYKHDYNFGVAAASPAGLLVPVVKAVDKKSLLEIASEIAELSERARNRRSRPEDLADGTFTITSLGKLGGLLATPIINYPEVAIMGVHNLQDRAVVRDGQIVIRKMMNLALSFDHRVVDGDVGASFTQEVKSYLENPERLMLEMR